MQNNLLHKQQSCLQPWWAELHWSIPLGTSYLYPTNKSKIWYTFFYRKKMILIYSYTEDVFKTFLQISHLITTLREWNHKILVHLSNNEAKSSRRFPVVPKVLVHVEIVKDICLRRFQRFQDYHGRKASRVFADILQ